MGKRSREEAGLERDPLRDERNFDDLSSDGDEESELELGDPDLPTAGGVRKADGGDGAGDSDGGDDDDGSSSSGIDEVYADMMDDQPRLSDAERQEEEEGEDLFDDDLLAKDYEEIPEQDTYEAAGLDDKQYEALTPAQRAQADRIIAQRHRAKRNERLAVRMPSLFLDEEDDDLPFQPRKRRKRRHRRRDPTDDATDYAGMDEQDREFIEFNNEEEDEDIIDFDPKPGGPPLQEWLVMDAPRRAVAKEFQQFLETYTLQAGKPALYVERIKKMCADNRASLEVSYIHLSKSSSQIAVSLVDAPSEMLEIFDEVALVVTLKHFPEYDAIHPSIRVRITDLPIDDKLRDIRQVHLNALIKVSGVVTRRTAVFPQMKSVIYTCDKCKFAMGPFVQGQGAELKPTGVCSSCNSKGPFNIDHEKTVFESYQRLTLQESPGSVPPGRLPRSKDVVLLHDLIDSARPGEEVDVTGVYKHNFDAALNRRQGFPVFSTVIIANYINKREDSLASFRISEQDEQEIRNLAKDPRIGQKLINSIAPSIYGHKDIKTAIALSLFGGVSKHVTSSGVGGVSRGLHAVDKIEAHHNIRGDINVLVLGDPGTAKSQFLKYVEKTAHRAVYTTGQGASAVGLTASVRKDPVTREWTLEGGALVLADRGVCMIDEFDKMNEKDRTSIHEAMEQQSISISKAGIVTTLQARCAIIAAANPVRGRYDPSLSFAQNVDLTEPILSRFDIMCVVRDTVNFAIDEHLATFVVESHRKSHPDAEGTLEDLAECDNTTSFAGREEPTIDQALLRKYILYARTHCNPSLIHIDKAKIENAYSTLRSVSQNGGGMPMTVRHLESVLRIAEANARMHLRSHVREDDVNMAMKVLINSFVNAQKVSVAKQFKKMLKSYITYDTDHNDLLLYQLQNLVREAAHYLKIRHGIVEPKQVEVMIEDFETRAREMDISDLEAFYASDLFTANHFRLDPSKGAIIRQF